LALSGVGPRPVGRTLLGAAILLLPILLYAPVRHHEWLNYDDPIYVTQSAPVRGGLSAPGFAWAFSSFDGANWFPLTRLSWMLDVSLWGLDDAAPFLATNVVLHAAASLVLFLALLRLTGRVGPAAFAAAIFAVHPLHVESVAWVAARKDALSGLCFAAALWAYGSPKRNPGHPVTRAAVALWLLLGLMAKPTLVSLPFVLLLVDGWPLGRLGRDGRPDRAAVRAALVEKWPLFLLVIVFSGLTFAAQRSGGTVASLAQVDLAARLANAAVSTTRYLGAAFWPTGLSVFYPHAGGTLAASSVALAAACLLLLTLAAVAARRERPYLLVGWLWFLVTLAPVIGIVQVGSQAMADRYMYLPLVGLAIAVGFAGADAAAAGSGRRAVAAAAVAAVLALCVVTRAQLRVWRDSEALFRHALAVTRDNHVAHAYLGTALLEQGRTAAAIAEYRRSLAVRPDQVTVANNLAWLLATGADPRLRDPDDAIAIAERAAALSGGEAPAVLDTLAAAYAAAGRFDDAVRTAERAAAASRRSGDARGAAAIERRARGYRAGRAWVEPAD
jgi:tetratricopeptide (TPR) repeat protein